MTYQEINKLTLEKLEDKLETEQNQLRKYRFAHAISPLEKTHLIQQVKKNIAKLHTALRTKINPQIHATNT